MEKQSQTRDLADQIKGVLNKPKEWFNIPLQEKMESLKNTDDKIRATIYNKKISKQTSNLNVSAGLKELIAAMKKNASKMEYIEVFDLLGDFHKIMTELKKISSDTYNKFKGDYKEVLVQDVDADKRKRLLELGERLRATSYINHVMTKEAGVMDWFKSISKGYKRGKELKHWSENNKQEAEKLKADTTRLLNYLEKTFGWIENSLKAMSLDLVRRNTVQYANNCKEIMKYVVSFDQVFKVYSKENIEPILGDLKKVHEAEEAALAKAKSVLPKENQDKHTKEEVDNALKDLENGVSGASEVNEPSSSPNNTPATPTQTPRPNKQKGKTKSKKKSAEEYSNLMNGIRKLAHMNIK